MDGIINIYKPAGMTSFACTSLVRRLTGSQKAGHGGTLDPQATGVLPVCLGKATKCADLFLEMPKRYRGEVTFGMETDTCDIWGSTVRALEPDDEKLRRIDRAAVEDAARQFFGKIKQIPPDYAAVKINGVPAYKIARQGKKVEMRSREVEIYEIHVIGFVSEPGAYPKAELTVKCSKGTYIRSLFRDIGERMGVCACMSALERTEYGMLRKEDAITPEALAAACEAGSIPYDTIGSFLRNYARIVLDEKEEKLYRCGVRFRIPQIQSRIEGTLHSGDIVRVYTENGRLLATAELILYDNTVAELKPDKFFDCGEDIHEQPIKIRGDHTGL